MRFKFLGNISRGGDRRANLSTLSQQTFSTNWLQDNRQQTVFRCSFGFKKTNNYFSHQSIQQSSPHIVQFRHIFKMHYMYWMHVCFICICFKNLQQGNDTDVNRIYLSNYRFTASTSYCEAHSHLVATPWLPSLIIKTSTPTISQDSTQVFISADCTSNISTLAMLCQCAHTERKQVWSVSLSSRHSQTTILTLLPSSFPLPPSPSQLFLLFHFHFSDPTLLRQFIVVFTFLIVVLVA